MSRETLIKNTLDNLSKLPDQKIREVPDFAEFLLKKSDDQLLTESIQQLAGESRSFEFLKDEEDLYSLDDLKEIYK
ncbi:DUF2281 domain-containing protein [Dyadobacter sp. CY345]|uniref:DUF2281 domain-containing protein n=1 Tax=Dyadobacter sp. CY345 TaxID=2909335 RepID=UPI001F4468D9|nr:DUF2281 domain-containing protein [Dyadobacter sp. CY345]MCF2442985.1 DUF2281 domain-containing protein [Dyadobacter sp. CY345]